MNKVILTAVLLFCLGSLHASTIPKGIISQDGGQAPPIKLKDLDGQDFDLATIKGKWKFVHFWASWCGPCRKEMPTIQDLSSKLNSQQWQIILINTAEDEDTVFNFSSIVTPDMVPLLDKDGLLTEKWQPRGLPSTYLVDTSNKIRYIALGGRPWNEDSYLEFLKMLAGSK